MPANTGSDHEPFTMALRLPQQFTKKLPHAAYYSEATKANKQYNISRNNPQLLEEYLTKLKLSDQQCNINTATTDVPLMSPSQVETYFNTLLQAIHMAAVHVHQHKRPPGRIFAKHEYSPTTELLFKYGTILARIYRMCKKNSTDTAIKQLRRELKPKILALQNTKFKDGTAKYGPLLNEFIGNNNPNSNYTKLMNTNSYAVAIQLIADETKRINHLSHAKQRREREHAALIQTPLSEPKQ